MDYDAQLRLQAFLDGELADSESRKVQAWIESDPSAAALAAELRNTGAALTGTEEDIRLPETREFFWSKVQRDIERLHPAVPESAALPLLARLRRLLVPAAAIAMVVIAGVMVTKQDGPEMETAVADAGAFTYRDYSAGTTLVWLSYPAENELADDDETVTLQ